MLNEKPNVRHRIGSARTTGCSSSSSSRVDSANSGFTRRANSARPFSSDHHSHPPRLYIGRPSSAPPVVPKRRPSSAPTQGGVGGSSPDLYSVKRGGGGRITSSIPSYKTHDVSHLNLKVEGKSIRSVAYTPRRHQPVNRGSLRVVSSHGYSMARQQKQFLSGYSVRSVGKPESGSDSDRSSVTDFGKTYAVPIALHHPMFHGSSSSLEHQCSENIASELGSTYTRQDRLGSILEDRFGSVYPCKKSHDVQKTGEVDYKGSSFHTVIQSKSREEESEISEGDFSVQQKYREPYFRGKSVFVNNFRGPLSDNSFDICRHYPSSKCSDLHFNECRDSYQHQPSDAVINHMIRKDQDTTSNDGSECTVISLGRRIQLMATNIQPSKEQQVSNNTNPKDAHWDSEWKQLLKQNHELLLKLSSREDNQMDDNNAKCHLKTVIVHDSGVQTNYSDVLNNAVSVQNFTNAADELIDKSDSGICSSDVRCKEDTYPSHSGIHSSEVRCEQDNYPSQTLDNSTSDKDFDDKDSPPRQDMPECLLEDILEESSQSNKSTQRSNETRSDADNLSANIVAETCVNFSECILSPIKDNTVITLNDSNLSVKDTTNKDISANDKWTPKVLQSVSDFSCTANLPTYRLGIATDYAVRSLFPYERQKLKSQTSKDLLEALQMIEDDEKKTQENREKEPCLTTQIDHNFELLSSACFQSIVRTETKATATDECKLGSVQKSSMTSNYMQRRDNKNFTTSASFDDDMNKERVEDPANKSCTATLPVMQVLVEKVFLFTQDLAERWQQKEFDESHDDLLLQLVQAEKLLEEICIQEGKKEDLRRAPDLHLKCEEKARKKQEEFDSRIQKNLELIRKLLDDKKILTEQCEELQKNTRIADKKHTDKLKLMEERHNHELKSLRERITTTEQEKREKWVNQKTKSIKESTYRSLESKMKDLSLKHRDEISQLKAHHWELLKEAEEKYTNQLRCQEEELKKKFDEEKEDICKREREREHQRLDLEIRQCEQHCLSRMEILRKQQEHDLKVLVEERHQNEEKLRCEHEASVRDVVRSKDQMIEQLQVKLEAQGRKHEEEIALIRHEDERSRSEWRTQYMREHNEARLQSEKEHRERLRCQRDKEIERVIKEIKQETTTREEEEHRNYDSKLKNLRERYELELNELETSEREARSRFLEMKSILAQKEEEVVYLRARLHSQDLELCELQHMFQPPGD